MKLYYELFEVMGIKLDGERTFEAEDDASAIVHAQKKLDEDPIPGDEDSYRLTLFALEGGRVVHQWGSGPTQFKKE